MKILVIEDEKAIADSVKDLLKKEGYTCELASSFPEAGEKIHLYEYDCAIVDLNLPGGSGLDLVQQLKDEHPGTGIIIVSARNSLDDKITGLELGSDDYITKPFHLSELNARIKALLRRKKFEGARNIIFNEIVIDPSSREVHVRNKNVQLTPKEYDLLLYFISNHGRMLTKNSIAEHLWGDEADQADSYDFLYNHIRNLRKKLVDAGCTDYIQTVYKVGYKFYDK